MRMTKRPWLRWTIEGGMALWLAAMLWYRFVPARVEAPTAANAKAFTLTGLDGKPIAPETYKGKAMVVNYWAPWCAPCRLEIPWLQKLQAENGGRLVVVGVVADAGEYARAAAMMKQKGVTYLLAEDSPELDRAFGNPAMLPTSFYLTPSAHVAHTVSGVVPEYMMRRYAKDAMGER